MTLEEDEGGPRGQLTVNGALLNNERRHRARLAHEKLFLTDAKDSTVESSPSGRLPLSYMASYDGETLRVTVLGDILKFEYYGPHNCAEIIEMRQKPNGRYSFTRRASTTDSSRYPIEEGYVLRRLSYTWVLKPLILEQIPDNDNKAIVNKGLETLIKK